MRLLLLFLFPVLLSAQEITKDSFYSEVSGGKYYSVRYTEYDNGNNQTVRTLVGAGTATDAYNDAMYRYQTAIAAMATDAAVVASFSRRLNELLREATAMKSLVNRSPIDTLQARFSPPLLVAGWQIKEPGGTRDVTFTVTAGGLLRFKVGTDATKTAICLGLVIRLINYPVTGTNTDLFRRPSGAFVDLLGNYFLKKP